MRESVFRAIRRDGITAVRQVDQLIDLNVRNQSGETPLFTAIVYGNDAVISELLRRGADVNLADENGQTPLHLAATYRRADLVDKLLRHGANVALVDLHGNSPLWSAVFSARGQYDTVRLMMEHGGGNVAERKNIYGRSPVDFARQIGDLSLLKILGFSAESVGAS